MTSLGVILNLALKSTMFGRMEQCGTRTILGRPVVPEVCKIYAMLLGEVGPLSGRPMVEIESTLAGQAVVVSGHPVVETAGQAVEQEGSGGRQVLVLSLQT